jgi:hypothetical protein
MTISIENLGTVNANKVWVGNLVVWFSYKTPVGFSFHGKRVCRQNDWSTTTGKLLNDIEPDHSLRVNGEVFQKLLAQAEIDNAREMLPD